MKRLIIVIVLLLLLCPAARSYALVLDFEDLPTPSNFFGVLPEDYHGFSWYGDGGPYTIIYGSFYTHPGSTYAITPGEYDLFMSRETPFNFTGAYMTIDTWDWTTPTYVEGWLNGVKKYSTAFNAAFGPERLNFDYQNIDEVRFVAPRSIQWGGYAGYLYLDDVTYDNTVVPEPATMFLFGIGSAAMAFARRKKRA